MHIRSKAFSLIELMVVVAIVTVLAAIAAPAYKNYAIRASFQDVLNFLQKKATEEKERYNRVGVWGNNGFQVLESSTVVNPEPSIPEITQYSRNYNSASNWRLYVEAYLNIDPSASVLGTTTGYLALVCSETDGVVECECRTATSGHVREIRSEYLPAPCRCNVGWNIPCP